MNVDVLIIGGGINGLLSAMALRREGLHVAVAEQGEMAQESTWAGAGILSPLLPWDYEKEVNALSERGRTLWPRLAEALLASTGIDPEYQACGMLAMGHFDKSTAESWCAAHGWQCAPATEFRPLDSDGNTASLWLPQVAQARNPRIARAVHAACAQSDITLLPHTRVTGFRRHADNIAAITTAEGCELRAERFVVCAGAWSRACLGDESLGLHIAPVRGQILLFKAEPGMLRHIVYNAGRYLVPRLDGHILAGSTLEEAGFDKSTTRTAHDELLHFALNTLPALAQAEQVKQWSGLRPGSPGNLPTIARHPALRNLYINSGHFRYGVTMAPASAELLAQILLEQKTTLPAEDYRWSQEKH